MQSFSPDEAARMAACYVKEYIEQNKDSLEGFSGNCSVLFGVEPLCLNARRVLGARKHGIKLGQFDIGHQTDREQMHQCMVYAVKQLLACAWNIRKNKSETSFDSGLVPGPHNRKGCIAFVGRAKVGPFGYPLKWARYYLSVSLAGVSDECGEQVAQYTLDAMNGYLSKKGIIYGAKSMPRYATAS